MPAARAGAGKSGAHLTGPAVNRLVNAGPNMIVKVNQAFARTRGPFADYGQGAGIAVRNRWVAGRAHLGE